MSNKANTGVIGMVREYYDELDSTNLFLHDKILQQTVSEGFTVIAGYQNAGRGQQTNKWHASRDKNILLSFLLKPTFLYASRAFDLNRFVSLGLLDMLSDYLPKEYIHVKWPNDIYVRNKKIAGILIQNTLRGKNVAYSIIGVGLNVQEESFPEDIVATSMLLEGSRYPDTDQVLEDLFSSLNKYHALFRGQSVDLEKEYQSALFRRGVYGKYKVKGVPTSGRILGVNDQGFLQFESIEGEQHQLMHGEIAFL